MIEFLNFIYEGSFFSILVLYLFMYVLGAFILIILRVPFGSARRSAFSLAMLLTLVSYLTINTAPIPPILQENMKNLLIQQAKEGVGSNAFLNAIIFPCADQKSGFVRGYNYGNALESYRRDQKNHLDQTEVFKVIPNDRLNIDKNLNLCDFAVFFNQQKFNELESKDSKSEPRI